MTLRLVAGWWARRGTHLPVAAAIAVVTAATVLADGGGRPALLAPLVVLAAGVLPGGGLVLGGARRQEAALLRLHGRRGVRWVTALAAEPVLTAVLGGAAGAALALALGTGTVSVVLVGSVWLVATVTVVAAMVVALRGPLTELLRPAEAERVRRTSALAALVPVVVAVAAVVALLPRTSSAPDVWAFTAPVVVGRAPAGLNVVPRTGGAGAGGALCVVFDEPDSLSGVSLQAVKRPAVANAAMVAMCVSRIFICGHCCRGGRGPL